MANQTERSIYKRNRLLITVGILLVLSNIVIIIIWKCTSLFVGMVDVSRSFSFNILTIDAVFAGFAYNTLSEMISFTSDEKIVQVDKDGYMDKYYNGVYITLFLYVLSMICGAITAFSKLGDMFHVIYLIQLILNLDAMVYFVITIFGFRKLINAIRNTR